ncbi:MAG: hypothetical protein V1770_03270 [bacterium]
MSQKQEITQRSAKADLFKAYQEMKEKVEGAEKNQLPLAQQMEIKKEEEKVLEKTESLIPQNLDDNISSLNKKVQETLNGLRDKLVTESEKLGELRKAIAIETKRLEETRNVKLADDTLQTLIADYELKQKELEKRRVATESSLSEEIESKRKTWEREQEEYKYNLKIERKKEEDAYGMEQAKKKLAWQEEINKKETELNEHEESLNTRAEELENMKAQIELFPAKLESAVEKTKKDQTTILQKDFDAQKQISESKWLSEKNLLEAKIDNLQEIMRNQNMEITSLKKSLYEANQRAQNLATTIVENASGGKMRQNEERDKEARKEE